MKTLNEHNAEREKQYHTDHTVPKLNGISCPKCGAELIDTNPYQTLLSDPPKKEIHCKACDYKGCRIV